MKSEDSIRAIIVDDELHALQLFKKVAELSNVKLDIIAEAQNLPLAVQLINELKPEVVFMDIEMPNFSGLQIRDFFGSSKNFELVYVTAHQSYAIEAMRKEAFDYLLKPIEISDLENCCNRLIKKLLNLKELEKRSIESNQNLDKKKVVVQNKKEIEYLELTEILYIEASSMYAIIHTKDREVIVSKPLTEFDYLLEYNFFRIHRSFLINVEHLTKISYDSGTSVEMTNGMRLPLARARKDEFKNYMNKSVDLKLPKK